MTITDIFLRPHLKIDSLSCMQQAQILEIPPRLLDYWPWHWTLRGPVLSHNLCGHQLSQFWPILRIRNDWPLFAHITQHLPFETVCVLSLLSNSLQLKLTKIEKLPVGQKFHIWLVFITRFHWRKKHMVDHSLLDPTDSKSFFKDSLVNISAVCRSATSCFQNAPSRWKPVFRVGALLYTSLYMYMHFAKKPENIKKKQHFHPDQSWMLFI